MTSKDRPSTKYTNTDLLEAAELYPSLWIKKYNIKNEVGFPLDFTKRKFLRDIYDDISPLQVVLKPPQVGMTVCMTLKSFYIAKKKNRQIIYTLPTQGDVQDMVGGSINRIIAQNPILMEWVKNHDTVEQKTVGNSMIFYRGTYTAKQAMMIPSGLNIHDEVDASDPNIVSAYENRLQAQEDGGWRWYFSHPSLSGHGVDVYWQLSDKKEWFVTCKKCGKEQNLLWPDNIDVERKIYICSSCKAELDDKTRINGKWKATSIGEFSGYHITQLMLYNKSAKDIIRSFDDPMKNKQYFYNYVLGLPYAGSDEKIEPSVVLKNCVKTVNDQEDTIVIGVDTGLPIHYVVGNKQGIFYYGKCKSPSATHDPYDELENLLRKWPSSIIVSDQGGDLIGIRKLQAKYTNRVFLCYYQRDKSGLEMIKWGEGDNYGVVTVDRNRMLQLTVEQLRDIGRIQLNGTTEEWNEFALHFGNIYREIVVVNDSKGKDNSGLYKNQFVWKRNGADHFVHSLVYCLVGLDRYSTTKAIVVESTGIMDDIPVARIFDNSANMSNTWDL